MSELPICIAVYNEEKTIHMTLIALEGSLKGLTNKIEPKIIVCVNGCTDQTESIIRQMQNDFSYPMRIIKSKKGKLRAHKEMLKHVKSNCPVMFMDADILVNKDTIDNLLSCFKENDTPKVVSAYPYVIQVEDLGWFRRAVYSIINFKRIHPQIEISREDVQQFHDEKINDPFLKRSRIYFHGRCFIIKNKAIYEFPKKGSRIRGDDTFLSFSVLHKSPKNTVRVLYDSPVYSYPLFSFKEYLRVWYRIRKDLDTIYEEYPKFRRIGKKTVMKLNWDFVKSLPIGWKAYALGFYLLKKYEGLSYHLIKKWLDIDKVWTYRHKGGFNLNETCNS